MRRVRGMRQTSLQASQGQAGPWGKGGEGHGSCSEESLAHIHN